MSNVQFIKLYIRKEKRKIRERIYTIYPLIDTKNANAPQLLYIKSDQYAIPTEPQLRIHCTNMNVYMYINVFYTHIFILSMHMENPLIFITTFFSAWTLKPFSIVIPIIISILFHFVNRLWIADNNIIEYCFYLFTKLCIFYRFFFSSYWFLYK